MDLVEGSLRGHFQMSWGTGSLTAALPYMLSSWKASEAGVGFLRSSEKTKAVLRSPTQAGAGRKLTSRWYREQAPEGAPTHNSENTFLLDDPAHNSGLFLPPIPWMTLVA